MLSATGSWRRRGSNGRFVASRLREERKANHRIEPKREVPRGRLLVGM